MMPYIFSLPADFSFLVFFLLGGVFFLIGRFTLYILSTYATHDALSVPIGAFIGTISTAWALSLGFFAADIWIVNAKATQAANEERSAIARMIGSASPNVLNAPKLSKLMVEYRKVVVENEWGANKNVVPSNEVDFVLQKIRKKILTLSKSSIPAPIITQLINDFDELQDSRNSRLSVGAASVDMYKWYLLISLTILTLVTIAAAHGDRTRAGVKALVIYSITSSFCLWILAIHANPYQGADPLMPNFLVVKIEDN